jgi:hypothetical protein
MKQSSGNDGIPEELKSLAQEARKHKTLEGFSNKLQELKQWSETRLTDMGYQGLGTPNETELYNNWYKKLTPEKKQIEDLYLSYKYRDKLPRSMTIADFYNQSFVIN